MNERIRAIFTEIPGRYERVNHVLTFGLDRVWRRAIASGAAAAGGARFLDLCTGTGETAHEIARRTGATALVAGADFTPPMMREGMRKRPGGRAAFVGAAATALPFQDGVFDVVTVSFATRNLNRSRAELLDAFREARRVLRPGGVFLNLETSRPPSGAVRAVFDLYARCVVGRAGKIMSGSSAGYAYLSGTLRSFYGADELAALIAEAGFERVSFRRFTLGVVALHAAVA